MFTYVARLLEWIYSAHDFVPIDTYIRQYLKEMQLYILLFLNQVLAGLWLCVPGFLKLLLSTTLVYRIAQNSGRGKL